MYLLINIMIPHFYVPPRRPPMLSPSPLRVLPIESPPDYHSPHLTRPGPNLIKLRVPDQAPRGDLAHIPHAAHALHSVKGTLGRSFGGVEDRSRAVLRVGRVGGSGVVGVEGTGDGVGVSGRGAEFGVHVCQFCLEELVVRDREAELGAGVGIGEDEGEGSGHDAGELSVP